MSKEIQVGILVLAVFAIILGTVLSIAMREPGTADKAGRVAREAIYNPDETLGALAEADRARLFSVGEKIFKGDPCGSCHQQGLPGGQLAGLGYRYNLKTLGDLLASPPAGMPRYPYTDDDRRALAVYLISTY